MQGITVRTAREEALLELNNDPKKSKHDIISAIIFAASNDSLKALCDVLQIEERAREIKNASLNSK
jgi:hypothetical protein